MPYRTPGRVHTKSDTPVRPRDVRAGHVLRENGKILVYTGRDWAYFPTTALDLIAWARRHRWGYKVEVSPKYEYLGENTGGDRMYRAEVKVVLHLAREAGRTRNAGQSKGFHYRLVWDTHRIGIFELTHWHRRTTTDPRWTEFGSVAEIRPIIARYPVLPGAKGPSDE